VRERVRRRDGVVGRIGRMATSPDDVGVEPAAVGDLPAVAAIYGFHVRGSASSFDLEPWTLPRWEQAAAALDPGQGHHLLVARSGGTVLGWAKSGVFRDRAAYASSVEVSVYVDAQAGGRGIGGALYCALFGLLDGAAPLHRAYAGITQPNPASVAAPAPRLLPRRHLLRGRPQVRPLVGRRLVRAPNAPARGRAHPFLVTATVYLDTGIATDGARARGDGCSCVICTHRDRAGAGVPGS